MMIKIKIITTLLFFFNVVWYLWAGNKNYRFWVPFAIINAKILFRFTDNTCGYICIYFYT